VVVWHPLVNELDFVLLCFKHAPQLLRVSVCVSRSLVHNLWSYISTYEFFSKTFDRITDVKRWSWYENANLWQRNMLGSGTTWCLYWHVNKTSRWTVYGYIVPKQL